MEANPWLLSAERHGRIEPFLARLGRTVATISCLALRADTQAPAPCQDLDRMKQYMICLKRRTAGETEHKALEGTRVHM